MCDKCKNNSCNSCNQCDPCTPKCPDPCECNQSVDLGCSSFPELRCIILKKDYPCLGLVKGNNFENLLDKLEAIACLSNQINCQCNSVTNINVSYNQLGITDINKYNVKLSWSPVSNATSYIVEYKQSFSSIWVEAITINTTSYESLIINGNSLSYDFRIKAICNNCNSNWTYKNNNIITPCAAPTDAYYDSINNRLVWNSSPYQPSNTFIVEMWRDDETTRTVINVSAIETPSGSGIYYASLNSINFSPNYVYHFCILNKCGTSTNTYSNHSGGCAFTCVVPNQTNPTITTITSNSAIISWSPIIGINSYNLKIVNTLTNTVFLNTTNIGNVNSYNISGLNQSTQYTVTLSYNCGSNIGCSGKNLNFTTIASTMCTSPNNLNFN